MGMTIAEKIIARAAGVEAVRPGDIHTVHLDRMMSNDGTTHLTVDMYYNKLKHPQIADAKKWYSSWIIMCLPIVPKRRVLRKKCGILPESMRLTSGKEKGCAIRL